MFRDVPRKTIECSGDKEGTTDDQSGSHPLCDHLADARWAHHPRISSRWSTPCSSARAPSFVVSIVWLHSTSITARLSSKHRFCYWRSFVNRFRSCGTLHFSGLGHTLGDGFELVELPLAAKCQILFLASHSCCLFYHRLACLGVQQDLADPCYGFLLNNTLVDLCFSWITLGPNKIKRVVIDLCLLLVSIVFGYLELNSHSIFDFSLIICLIFLTASRSLSRSSAFILAFPCAQLYLF